MRTEVLKNLILLSKPIFNLKKSLKFLDWDSENKVLMDKTSVTSVLKRFIYGEIDLETVLK